LLLVKPTNLSFALPPADPLSSAATDDTNNPLAISNMINEYNPNFIPNLIVQ